MMENAYPLLINFNPVALQLGPLKVHWYGLMYLAAFASFWVLVSWRARRKDSPIKREQISDLLFYGMLGVIIGGRVGYMLVYGLEQLLANPLSLFKIWEGGMSFHGGLVGVMVALAWFAQRQRRGFFEITDLVVPMVPLGLMFGRIGNFVGGELWGRFTDVGWGMLFPKSIPGIDPNSAAFMQAYLAGNYNGLARHPSQLYQALLEGLLLFLLLWFYSRKPRPRMAVSGWFLIGYGVFRSFAEIFREPDAQLGFIDGNWLTMGMLLSLLMLVIGTVLVILAYVRHADVSRVDAAAKQGMKQR